MAREKWRHQKNAPRASGDNELRQQFIDAAIERSDIDTGIVPEITNRILTLSTCTGYTKNTRWVVQARLVSIQDAK